MKINSKAVVVTPTIGSPSLKVAIESVINQTYKDVIQIVIVDGEEFSSKVDLILNQVNRENIKVITLPFNTGYNLFNGHRIYAAMSYLVESEFVFLLDEDNWYDENHIGSLVSLLEDNDLDWAYSMRKIFDHKLQLVASDKCESIGPWPPYSGMSCLVDTSCYAIRRNLLAKVGHHWLERYFADRVFFQKISEVSNNFDSTCLYTLNYILKEDKQPSAQFFLDGNRHMLLKYGGALPWTTKRK